MKFNLPKLLFLLAFITAIIIFMVGMHNIDLAYNFKGAMDCNGFICQGTEQLYGKGTIEIYASMVALALIITFISAKAHNK